jgi:hypothetical protein
VNRASPSVDQRIALNPTEDDYLSHNRECGCRAVQGWRAFRSNPLRRPRRTSGDRYWPRLTARPWCPDRSTVGVSGSSRHPAASACTASCGTYSCWSVVAVAQQSAEDHAYLRDDQHHEIPRLGESPCGMQWDGRAATEKCFSSHLKGIATVPASLLVETMRIR